jgi:hypothetical protein
VEQSRDPMDKNRIRGLPGRTSEQAIAKSTVINDRGGKFGGRAVKAVNRIPENSQWDDDVLRDVLGELQAEGEDAIGLGFSPNELTKLLTEPDDLEVKEIETGPVSDEFWISLRGPLAQQANALKALQEAMKPFAGVTVEQGTINLG